MATNPSIRALLDQSVGAISATSLSSVVSTLSDYTASAQLVDAAQRSLCKDVLAKLLAVANDDGKHVSVRILGLEALYWISQVPDENFRQGELFATVQQLNESFDMMLLRDGEVLEEQHEMLASLLFRCTGYIRLNAGSVLAQICGGSEGKMVRLLLRILCNQRYEWPLLQAAIRCLYELTTPVSYFQPPEAGQQVEATKVTAFQSKINAFMTQLAQESVLQKLANELIQRWTLSATSGKLVALDSTSTGDAATAPTGDQQHEVLQWAVLLRYVSVLFYNLSEYCDQMALTRTLQQSLLCTLQPFMHTVLIPFVQASLQCWRVSQKNHQPSTEGDDKNPLINSAVAVLRLLRYGLYKPTCALTEPLLRRLAALTHQVVHLHPQLRRDFSGMLIMLLVVECLCNVDAVRLAAPVDLSLSVKTLVSTIAADTTPIRSSSACSTAQGFAICLLNEKSSFCETSNDTVSAVHKLLEKEEQRIKEDTEAIEAIEMLEAQLDTLQAIIVQLALGDLLNELSRFSRSFDTLPPQGAGSRSVLTAGPLPAVATPKASAKKEKIKHPSAYCCGLTHKLMREPVKLRSGNRYEYDALMKVVESIGHVDPVSGEAIDEDIEVNAALKREIDQYRVTRAASKHN